MLARTGHDVTLIGRAPHVQAIEAGGLLLRLAGRVEAVRIAATTDLAAVQSADLVLFCVKSTDTDATARQIAPLLGTDAAVLSLQNGVDNAAAIARHVRQTVIPAVVYVATAMPEPGVVTHHGRGDLVIGPLDAARPSTGNSCRPWSTCSPLPTCPCACRLT
jgi:2-dehydropantoate 2-reductase